MADVTPPIAPLGLPLKRLRDLSAKNAGRDPETGKVRPHVRNEQFAQVVAQMAAVGTPINTIAVALGIRPGQLKEQYSHELEHAAEIANSTVALAAYRMASSGEDPSTTRFWLKARNRWKDGEGSDGDGQVLNLHIHT